MNRVALATALLTVVPAGGVVDAAGPARPSTSAAIAAADVLADIGALASPAMEGRGVLTPGLARAGDYIAARFAAAGLRGAADAGGYFQAVEIPVPPYAAPGTAFSLDGNALVLGKEFVPGPGAAATRALGPVVFAGYGIVVADRHDDYAGIDARGKLVVCLRYGPGYDPRTRTTRDPAFAAAVTVRRKIELAVARGAIGIAFVDSEAATLPDLAELPVGSLVGAATNIASFHLRADTVDRLLLTAGGRSVASLRKTIDETGTPASFELPATADFRVQWSRSRVRSRNVIAFIEGSDPALRDEVVAIGAHYDHLGLGDEGSSMDGAGSVHPGGDDNASGTAALLEIAEAFAGEAARATSEAARPRRSILFAAFTGEEKGMLGSTAVAVSSRRKLVAMINLDMVGRMRNDALEVGGASTSAAWQPLVTQQNLDRLVLSFPQQVVPNSDHAPFLIRGVPSLFLFTGLHGDYHRVSDTGDKVNADGVARVARLAFRLARAVANRDDRLVFVAPVWTGGGPAAGAQGSAR
ncbi:MAG TPA: M28 family peptidase [Polyangia bacterium]|nr:M28 family peptidase [Polyangia bacterium]